MKKIVPLLFLALAAALVVPSSRQQILDKLTPIMDTFRVKQIPARLENIADGIEAFQRRSNPFPGDSRSFETFLRESYQGVPEDPWGNLWYMRAGRNEYTIGTMGPDGVMNTEDDITLTREILR